MASQLLTNTFLELLEKSELLSPQRYEAAVRKFSLDEMPSGYEAAKTLVLNGVLSRFQADRLMQGRYRGFFIGNYKVLEILGVGGMGWVYTAEDLETGKVVALKVLSEHHKHIVDMQARMRLEVRAGQKLNHPNIVHAYKSEHKGDVDFLITDFVEGVNLQELLGLRGRFSVAQACDFVRQAAKGLQHAHERGLIHRDIKPANLIVDRTGNVKILDFGLALIPEDEDEFSLAMIFGHDCLGTDDFIPPEQIRDSYSVDARADIYSLGCTLYLLLTGHIPYPLKTTKEKLRAHLKKKPVPLKHYLPELPDEIVAIVEKMMAKDPENRYQTAEEVAEALEPYAERKEVLFDFPAILVERCKDAERRLAAHKSQRRKQAESTTASSIARRRLADSSSRRLEAFIDTGVPGETRPRHSAVSLVHPLSSAVDQKPVAKRPTPSTPTNNTPRQPQRKNSQTAGGSWMALLISLGCGLLAVLIWWWLFVR